MNVLALSYEMVRSHGWGRYSVELIHNLELLGDDVEAYAGSSGGSSQPEVRVHAILHSPLAERGQLVFSCLESLRLVGAARRASIIHAMDESVLPIAYYLSSWTGRPFVATLHGTYCVEAVSGPRQRSFRKMLSAAAMLIAVSSYTKQRFLAGMPEVEEKTRVVSLGVAPELVDNSPLPADAREPVLLSVGAVKRRKGLLQVVRALGVLRETLPDARVVAAGMFSEDDPYISEVRREAALLGVADRVVMLGEVDEDTLNSLYRQARALVMPSQNVGSHFEGFGLVHLEAAAKGLPAIGSLNCGNEAAIRDGETGFLVGQSDVGSLADRIARLFNDDALWDEMSLAAVNFAKLMNWSHSAFETRAAYEAVSRKVSAKQ